VNVEQARRIRWHFDIAYLMELNGGKFRTFCECGVGPLDIAAAPKVYDHNLSDRMILVEPNPLLADIASLRMPKAKLIRAAIGPKAGRAKFRMNMGSSYLSNTWSPTPVNAEDIEVDVIKWDEVDDGTIDCMVLDNEGQEWPVLAGMISRPSILSVEVWRGHPHEADIFRWMDERGYKLRFTTGPDGETMLFTLG
jgi:FkbM family methyltransferase